MGFRAEPRHHPSLRLSQTPASPSAVTTLGGFLAKHVAKHFDGASGGIQGERTATRVSGTQQSTCGSMAPAAIKIYAEGSEFEG